MRYAFMLLLATAVSCGLLATDMVLYHTGIPVYMIWNLFLAWIPFLFALLLVRFIRRHSWSGVFGTLLTIAWLVFLPNSFYMVSDFIHLSEVADPSQLLFSAVMFMSFIATGVLLGMGSLYLVHQELRRRLPQRMVAGMIVAILLICSMAIYIGRDLRWNSWDLLIDPAGMVFDVSMRLQHPTEYGAIARIVGPFFVLLTTLYGVAWQALYSIRGPQSDSLP